jgi:hypothetical protein
MTGGVRGRCTDIGGIAYYSYEKRVQEYYGDIVRELKAAKYMS